jgi:hypothetical protein
MTNKYGDEDEAGYYLRGKERGSIWSMNYVNKKSIF